MDPEIGPKIAQKLVRKQFHKRTCSFITFLTNFGPVLAPQMGIGPKAGRLRKQCQQDLKHTQYEVREAKMLENSSQMVPGSAQVAYKYL